MDSLISEFSRAAAQLLIFSDNLEMIRVSRWIMGSVAPELVYEAHVHAPGLNSGVNQFANVSPVMHHSP